MKTLMNCFMMLILNLALSGSLAQFAVAAPTTRILDPLPYLDEELFYMKHVETFLFSVEKTRMKMFEVYTAEVIRKLNDPDLGLGNEQTAEAFKDQISAIDAAESYFHSIRNNYTQGGIDKITEIQNRLVTAYSYNPKGYARNLWRLMTQMEYQLRELTNKQISTDLQDRIRKLYAPLGIAISDASLGDTRLAYASARPVTEALSAMYGDFHHLSSSNEIFEAALMIEFLNERLISYGQYDLN